MYMIRLFRRSALSLIAAIGCAALLAAANASAEEPKIDPQAAKILKAMSDALAAAPMFSASASTLHEELQPGGMTYLRERAYLIFVNRPNRLHVRSISDDGIETYFWYSGKQLARLIDNGSERLYTQIDVPGTLDAMLDFLVDTYYQNLPVADLLYADP